MKVQFSTYRRSARTDSSQDRLLRPLTCHSPVTPGLTNNRRAVLSVPGDLAFERWARADERHVALDHVEQLRQFVERVPPDEAADPGDPRVLADLEQHSGTDVVIGDVVLVLVGADDHAAELVHRERGSAASHPLLTEEDRSSAADLDRDRDGEQCRRDHHQDQHREDPIEDVLHDPGRATVAGGAHLQQGQPLERGDVQARADDVHKHGGDEELGTDLLEVPAESACPRVRPPTGGQECDGLEVVLLGDGQDVTSGSNRSRVPPAWSCCASSCSAARTVCRWSATVHPARATPC